LISEGPDIVQEVLFKAHLKGFKIVEIPIKFIDRRLGKSKLNIRALFKGYVMVLRLKIDHILGRL
jgi:dolichol-phosphate mannosyltransferase